MPQNHWLEFHLIRSADIFYRSNLLVPVRKIISLKVTGVSIVYYLSWSKVAE